MTKGTSPAARGNSTTRLGATLRDLMDRVRVLESRSSNRVGDWKLFTNDQGNLAAVHNSTGIIKVLADISEET